MPSTSDEVTQLLIEWNNGDQAALDRLMPLIYGELRQMARRYMSRQNSGHTLQTTALINEAFIKLVGQPDKQFQNRAHFFGVAAQAMRHVLVDYARSKQYAKRGGDAEQVSLDQAAMVSLERSEELLALDDALNRLATLDPRQSRIVELRYFGGLSADETAEVLSVSDKTIQREWAKAKGWLYRELNKTGSDGE